MNLLTRPVRNWNDIVGQDRVVRVLHALLRKPDYMTRGLIFSGPYATGKTSTAYMMARALMCAGGDPLGCGRCGSCLAVAESLEATESPCLHPDFTEVDAASHSSVKDARALVEKLSGPPILGPSHVVVIDEAHRLSTEAFDVFLKPLDLTNTSVSVLFLTTDLDKIPLTIQSRCAKLQFQEVSTENLTGMLSKMAGANQISYTQEGLETVAHHSKGRPRDAAVALGMVAACGAVTQETAQKTLPKEPVRLAHEVFGMLIMQRLTDAVAALDALSLEIGPVKAVEALFATYARDVFRHRQFMPFFPDAQAMNNVFLRWCVATLPADALPLLLLEIDALRQDRPATVSAPPVPPPSPKPAPREPEPEPESSEEEIELNWS